MESNLNQQAIDELVETLFICDSKKDLFSFLRDVATAKELNEIAGRWQAAQLINQGVSYRKVSEKTGLSTATVTRVAAWLNGGTGGYKAALAKAHHVH